MTRRRVYHTVESAPNFAAYATTSCAFTVAAMLDIDALQRDGQFVERAVAHPYVKDYDAIPINDPLTWPMLHDTTAWRMFSAFDGETRVGGAIIAPQSPLAHHGDAAELWDLRVAPAVRGRGVGRLLFDATVEWCRRNARSVLLIETQHTNVAACRFYQARGCTIDAITPEAYSEIPGEMRIVWRLNMPNIARDI